MRLLPYLEAAMRVHTYVDGFNLYYRALKKSPYKWLNLLELSKALLKPDDNVTRVRYFTARISSRSGNPNAPQRQQIYLNALETVPEIDIHFGKFLPKSKFRPLKSNPNKIVQILDTEEKGSDVNLASFMLNDGWQGRYDAALVFSQDTDLCEPIRMVKEDLKLPIGVVWLDGRQPSPHLTKVASFVRQVRKSHLRASQFPNLLKGKRGKIITKPTNW